MIFLSFLCARIREKTIAQIANDYARIDINNTGSIKIFDLKTGFLYGRAQTSIKGLPRFNATLVKATDECVEIMGYRNEFYIHYTITSRKTHFIFEILDSSKITGRVVSFPYMFTGYDNVFTNHISGISMNDEYSSCLRTDKAQCRYATNKEASMIFWDPVDGYYGEDTRVFLIVGPTPGFRQMLQKYLISENCTYSLHGGPFALDSPKATASYTFAITGEDEIDDYIAMALRYGIKMIFLNGYYETWGHYEPNKKRFPNGIQGLKTAVDKIHKAGLYVGMYTKTAGIGIDDKYVVGKPDDRLAFDYTYTLSKPLSETDTEVYINEVPEKDFDTVWGFKGHGNVIRIGDELISYHSLLPNGFGKCTRGDFNTTAKSYSSKAQVKHMYANLGTFMPGYDTTLFEEVAQNIANIYNLGFDYIYTNDATATQNGRLGIEKFRRAIFNAIKDPGSDDTSSGSMNLWPITSRLASHDPVAYGIKSYVDRNVRDNLKAKASLYVTQVGWWALFNGNHLRYTQLYDEFEYMCCKANVNDMNVAFQKLTPGRIINPKREVMMSTFKQWELLRRNKLLTEEEKAILKVEKKEFHIEGDVSEGNWQIRKSEFPEAIMKQKSNVPAKVNFNNPFESQQMRLRVMPLFSQEAYNSPNQKVMIDCKSTTGLTIEGNENVTATLSIDRENVKESESSMKITVKNERNTRDASWAKITRTFTPLLNGVDTGIGVWVYGDGKGEVLNFQTMALHAYIDTYDEHYIVVDFKGWKYFEIPLMERSAGQYSDYSWSYDNVQYTYIVYNDHEHLRYLNLYVNNVPENGECNVLISPVKLLPIVQTTIKSLSIKTDCQEIKFEDINLPSGEYFEFVDKTNCNYFTNRRPDQTGKVKFTSNVDKMTLNNGNNEFEVKYEIDTVLPDVNPRVKMTLFEYGDVVASRGDYSNQENADGLSGGEIVGVIIGVLLLISIIAVGGFIVYKKFYHHENTDLENAVIVV